MYMCVHRKNSANQNIYSTVYKLHIYIVHVYIHTYILSSKSRKETDTKK